MQLFHLQQTRLFAGVRAGGAGAPEDAAGGHASYSFNTHKIQHHFCPVCGVGPFGRGADGSGQETFAINVRCLDEVDPATLEIQAFDGRSL